jgi:hypothetical protein
VDGRFRAHAGERKRLPKNLRVRLFAARRAAGQHEIAPPSEAVPRQNAVQRGMPIADDADLPTERAQVVQQLVRAVPRPPRGRRVEMFDQAPVPIVVPGGERREFRRQSPGERAPRRAFEFLAAFEFRMFGAIVADQPRP